MEEELKNTKKAISNILDAMEQGIFSSSTKARLEELEAKEKELTAQIAVSVPEYLNVTKTDVIAWLDSFKNEDVTSKKGQERLIKSFLTKAYLYDDKIHIVTDLFGGTEDLKRCIIRCVGTPTERFTEDALRILRALRCLPPGDGGILQRRFSCDSWRCKRGAGIYACGAVACVLLEIQFVRILL